MNTQNTPSSGHPKGSLFDQYPNSRGPGLLLLGFLVGIPSMILGAMAGAVLAGALIIAGALLILADQTALTARRDP